MTPDSLYLSVTSEDLFLFIFSLRRYLCITVLAKAKWLLFDLVRCRWPCDVLSELRAAHPPKAATYPQIGLDCSGTHHPRLDKFTLCYVFRCFRCFRCRFQNRENKIIHLENSVRFETANVLVNIFKLWKSVGENYEGHIIMFTDVWNFFLGYNR